MRESKVKSNAHSLKFNFNNYIIVPTKKHSLTNLKKRHIQKNIEGMLSKKIATSLFKQNNHSQGKKLKGRATL